MVDQRLQGGAGIAGGLLRRFGKANHLIIHIAISDGDGTSSSSSRSVCYGSGRDDGILHSVHLKGTHAGS